MGLTACAAPRSPSSTRREICAPASFCWDTSKLESTVHCLGIEVDDALALSEQVGL
jgi:hypothetical protein